MCCIHTADTCFIDDSHDYGGTDIDGVAAPDPAGCCDLCTALDTCFCWSWSTVEAKCYRKSAKTVRAPNAQVISGYRVGGIPKDQKMMRIVEEQEAAFFYVCILPYTVSVVRCHTFADCAATSQVLMDEAVAKGCTGAACTAEECCVPGS